MNKMTDKEKQFVDSVLQEQETRINEIAKEKLSQWPDNFSIKQLYDALIEQGFTKEQALELCKKLLF